MFDFFHGRCKLHSLLNASKRRSEPRRCMATDVHLDFPRFTLAASIRAVESIFQHRYFLGMVCVHGEVDDIRRQLCLCHPQFSEVSLDRYVVIKLQESCQFCHSKLVLYLSFVFVGAIKPCCVTSSGTLHRDGSHI